MKLIEDLDNIKQPLRNAVITIGNFDGVHIGHQALFHTVIEKADEIDGAAVAMTFEPHPIRVLRSNDHPPLITMYEQKTELISRSGLDVLICVPFTREFAAISARRFIKDLLVDRLGMKAIVVGNDYTFGRNREGDLDLLNELAEAFDFQVVRVDWIQATNGVSGRISSTRIRELVREGDVLHARKLLGRHYQIRGEVATGRNRGGKLLGFPTANINLHDELCPKMGIYAVTVYHRGRRFDGVANIGYSPTFDDHVFTVEVHLLDFDENLYGEQIRVNFIQRLRDEIKFDSIDELARQIQRDIDKARLILAA